MLPAPQTTPPGLRHVGRYERHLPVSLERMFENALDWEHLPWLHSSSFGGIELLASGSDFWRAEVRSPGNDQATLLELRLDADERTWVTHTLDGPGQGGQVFTVAIPDVAQGGEPSKGLVVVVDFYLAGLAEASEEQVTSLGTAFRSLYARLYDEDEAMMVERQRAIDDARTRTSEAITADSLGPVTALRTRLPLEIIWGGREWRIVECGNQLRVHATQCPHRLGPLASTPDGAHAECPWHGYRFDTGTGREQSGRNCRLPVPPELRIDGSGNAWLADSTSKGNLR